MTFYGAIYWPSPETCLDEAFDAADLAADAELCRAIAAGKAGLHPDGWGNHDPQPLRWLLRKRREPPPAYYYDPTPAQRAADKAWEAQHRRRPVEPSPWKPKPRPKPHWTPAVWGTIELTCDVCDREFGPRLDYGRGQRDAMAAGLRAIGAEKGWTHIAGRDRCPECSAPEDEGDGAGERDHDKQHADGG